MRARASTSFWEADTYFRPFDLIVIGGGIVGLNTAISAQLNAPGARIGVLERGVIPTGASTRNAGFACFGSPSEILADIEANGEDQAFELVERRYRGLQTLLSRVDRADIDYHASGGGEVFLEKDEDVYARCMSALPRMNQALKSVFNGDLFVPVTGGIDKFGLNGVTHVIQCPYEGMLHPAKMVMSLTRKAKVIRSAGL